MANDIIFQYMLTGPSTDARGDIRGWKRSDLYNKVADISRQSFMQYADKIGAAYLFSDERVATQGHGCALSMMFECVRVYTDPLFDKYDNVLFVDTDIVVNTDENIFDVTASGAEVYGVLESDIVTDNGGGYNSWDYKESVYNDMVAKFSQHGAPVHPALPPNRPSKMTIMNTGVVLWTKEARLKARELFDDWQDWCYGRPEYHMAIMNDQPYLSAMFAKYDFDVETLPQKWNDSPHYQPYDKFFEVANFCHYTGGEWKVDMIDHWNERKYKTSV